jgi:hypothetical protein
MPMWLIICMSPINICRVGTDNQRRRKVVSVCSSDNPLRLGYMCIGIPLCAYTSHAAIPVHRREYILCLRMFDKLRTSLALIVFLHCRLDRRDNEQESAYALQRTKSSLQPHHYRAPSLSQSWVIAISLILSARPINTSGRQQAVIALVFLPPTSQVS